MRKLLVITALAAVLTLGLLTPRGASAPALPDKPARYEYAEVRYTRTLVAGPGGRMVGGAGNPGAPGGRRVDGAGLPGAPGGGAAPAQVAAPATEIRTI